MTSRTTGGKELLLTYYGDDTTGSTDSLEAAAMAGIPAMLYLSPPTPSQLAEHPGLRVVGVAGTSRSRSPEWMSDNLPDVFVKLKALGAPLCHYKTCSTFDSSPTLGSIGRAIDIGIEVFQGPALVVVGVPPLRRFVVFSNLFAAASVAGAEEVYRIDRHPTMSHHPATSMNESDLRVHLAHQTDRSIAGFDFVEMLADGAETRLDELMCAAEIVILDTFDAATMRRAGQLLARHSSIAPAFVAGSSGVEYALFGHLAAEGNLPIIAPPTPRGPVDKIVAAFGSCSPVTEQQIAWAEENGLAIIPADTVALIQDGPRAEAVLSAKMAETLSQRAGAIVYTARGPGDPQIVRTQTALDVNGGKRSSQLLGESLGRILRNVIDRTGVRRAVLGGGDTSSYAVRQLGVTSMDVAGPLVRGAPLCRLYAGDRRMDGVEIALKGGQVGRPDFLATLFAGH